ncbi:MAG: nucleotidyltransferase [Akkermansiaceae bacterium]|nr:nucleotidyltransferase [Akkermansiaceae bacterium]
MKDLVEEAAELQALLESKGWDFCFIGGLAIQRWSEPRLTKDMDLTMITGFGDEEPFVDFLLGHYTPRRSDARDFALFHRVLLLQTASGIGIDIALAGLPFEELAVRRSILVDYAPGIKLRTCTAEDLIVMKAFADRPQDRLDLRGILVRQGTGNLDWNHIWKYLTPLAEVKESPAILTHLKALFAEVRAGEANLSRAIRG